MSTKDHVAVRLDSESLTRVDTIRTLLDTEWRDATRSDVLRLLILKGLEHFEKKHRSELDKKRASGPAEPVAAAPKRARRKATAKAPPAAAKQAPALPPKRARKKGPAPST